MKKRSEWQGQDWPVCPNNARHIGLVPDKNGGWVCEECRDNRTARSREPFRWAFAERKNHE